MLARGTRHANTHLLNPVRPIILIVQMRDDDLGSASQCSSGRGARSTVMHDGCNSVEQLFVRNFTN